jgi:hypothetical protein
MKFVAFILVFWSVIATVARAQGGLPTINTPLSCRAPLPIEWFINNMQSGSKLPPSTKSSLAAASKTLSSYIESLFTTGDTISVVVGAPWGPILELNLGNLRNNATDYSQTVNSQSLYRVASTTKVRLFPNFTNLVDLHGSGITHFTAGGEIVSFRFTEKIHLRTQYIVRCYLGIARKSNVWTQK